MTSHSKSLLPVPGDDSEHPARWFGQCSCGRSVEVEGSAELAQRRLDEAHSDQPDDKLVAADHETAFGLWPQATLERPDPTGVRSKQREAFVAGAQWASTSAPCQMKCGEPFDFAWCETHDTTFRLGGTCKFDGRDPVEVYADEAEEQRARAIRAEAALEEAAGNPDERFVAALNRIVEIVREPLGNRPSISTEEPDEWLAEQYKAKLARIAALARVVTRHEPGQAPK